MFIRTELTDFIGSITLNQPTKRNALSKALIEEVLLALKRFQEA
jgi:enoyl-CoA hydratase/carnithine racemase